MLYEKTHIKIAADKVTTMALNDKKKSNPDHLQMKIHPFITRMSLII